MRINIISIIHQPTLANIVKLPNVATATVAIEKLTDYLLGENHPVGKGKAQFFRNLGFDSRSAESLRSALLALAGAGEVTAQSTSERVRSMLLMAKCEAPDERQRFEPSGSSTPIRSNRAS